MIHKFSQQEKVALASLYQILKNCEFAIKAFIKQTAVDLKWDLEVGTARYDLPKMEMSYTPLTKKQLKELKEKAKKPQPKK